MKLRKFLLLLTLPAMVLLFEGCDKCTDTGTITFGEDVQNFTIKYITPDTNQFDLVADGLVDAVHITFFDPDSKEDSLGYNDDLSDNILGPIPYVTHRKRILYPGSSPAAIDNNALMGEYHDLRYIMTFYSGGTFVGADTFDVNFAPLTDECKSFWQTIEYFRNGNELGEFNGQEKADMVFNDVPFP